MKVVSVFVVGGLIFGFFLTVLDFCLGTQEVIQDISDAPRQNSEENHIRGNSAFRTGRNRNRDIERIRQSTGDWQTDPNMEWKRHTLVQPLRKSTLHEAKELM